MKKINSSGFVLAETLIVTVFLMTIFTMIYMNFLPLAGEYEKREAYDSVDGKYSVYWLKRIIEDSSYDIPSSKENWFRTMGYARFECSDVADDSDKRNYCINLVKNLQVEGCDKYGDGCDIFITKYRLDNSSDSSVPWFKNIVTKGKNTGSASNPKWVSYKKYEENCTSGDCLTQYVNKCVSVGNGDNSQCNKKANKNLFSTGFKDYVVNLPDYTAESLNYANYRVIAIFHNKKDNNNYYSYATIEVNR